MPIVELSNDEWQFVMRSCVMQIAQQSPQYEVVSKMSGQLAQQQQQRANGTTGKPSVDNKEKRDGRVRTERHDRHGDANTE